MSGKWIKAVVLMACLGVGAVGSVLAEPDQAMVRLFEAQQRIAEKGEPEAVYHLAEMYEQGLGTPRDMNKAQALYAKAAERGHAGAKNKIARWNQMLEGQKLAEQNRAREREEAARAAEQERAKLAAAKAAAERERAAEAVRAKDAARQTQRAREQADADAARQKAAAKAAEHKRAEDAAAAAKAASAAEARKAAAAPAPATTSPQEDDKSFSSNPCKGPTARFLSTCQ